MRTSRDWTESAGASLETRCDSFLLGRLGHELARLYEDTLKAPAPPTLQRLVERLTSSSPSHDPATISSTDGGGGS